MTTVDVKGLTTHNDNQASHWMTLTNIDQ